MREADTAAIPYAKWETDWAHRRPAPHRTPLPAPGDEVFYRHDYWLPPVRAEVVSVQSLDDLTDPHLWEMQQDGMGGPLLVDGRQVLAKRFDPWPTLRLQIPGIGLRDTREARLRGSPGWLPLDWETRFRPTPDVVVVR